MIIKSLLTYFFPLVVPIKRKTAHVGELEGDRL